MVGSPRPGVDGRSGDGKDLAALFQCHPGGDQRPRARARLDDDDAPGDARNQTVAAGEITGQGPGTGRNHGDQGAFGDDSFIEGLDFLRIHHVESAAQHRQRPGGDGPFMGGCVDAPGHARNHQQPTVAEIGGDLAGEAAAVDRGVAGADDGDRLLGQEMRVAKEADQRWRVLDVGEERRVVGPAPADEAGADPFQGLHLGLGLSLREHLDTLTAAVARQVRQRLQGRPGGGESFQELIKHDRTDVVRSDQAQPVQLFGVGKRLRAGFVFVGHSGRGWSRFSGGVKGMRLYGKEFLLCSIAGKGCLARGNRDGALIKNKTPKPPPPLSSAGATRPGSGRRRRPGR